MKRTSWNDFDSAGLLWFINSILHVFGYAIALTYDTKTGKVIEAYPARVKYRGFKESSILSLWLVYRIVVLTGKALSVIPTS